MIQSSARPHTRTPQNAAFPAIVRPPGAPHAANPAPVPEPAHHHLPSWVKRAYAQARPILADLLGSLDGDLRDELQRAADDVTERISSGKFSLAFQYPQLISSGMDLYRRQQKADAEAARAARVLDVARRRAGEILRDAGPRLSADVTARLHRSLRAAASAEEIAAVEAEVRQATDSAQSVEGRRREREINRTRTKIQRAAPRGQVASASSTETWQDVLRRLQEQMTEDGAG